MRSLTARYNTDRRSLGKPNRVVGRKRGIDRSRPTKAHVRAQRAHPLGGTVTRYLRDMSGTPTFCACRLSPKPRVEQVGDTLDHVLLAHLDLDYRIGRPAIPISEERALTLEEACQPRAITGFLGRSIWSWRALPRNGLTRYMIRTDGAPLIVIAYGIL